MESEKQVEETGEEIRVVDDQEEGIIPLMEESEAGELYAELENESDGKLIEYPEDTSQLIISETLVEDPAITAERQAQAREEYDRRLAAKKFMDELANRYWIIKGESLLKTMESIREELPVVISDQNRPVSARIEDTELLQEKLDELGLSILQHKDQVGERVTRFSEQRDGSNIEDSAILEEKPIRLQKRVEKHIENQVTERLAKLPKPRTRFGWLQMAVILLLIVSVGVGNYYLSTINYNKMMSSSNAQLLVETASLYQASGENDESIRLLDEAMMAGIQDPAVLGRVGEMYRVLKEYDKAIQILSGLNQADPSNRTILTSLARAYNSNGKAKESQAFYEKLINMRPNEVAYRYELSQVHRKLGNIDAAIQQLDKAIEIRPSYYQALFLKGDIFREQLKYDEAIFQYQKTLEIKPDLYSAFIGLGRSYMGKRDFSVAIDTFLIASDTNPERIESYFLIGESYTGMGNFESAIEYYQKAIAINGTHVLSLIGMGNAYAALDDCTNAVPQYREALKNSPEDEHALQGLNSCLTR